MSFQVLVVDDDEDFRGGVAAALGPHGWTVDEVGDVAAAKDALRARAYDIVLVDGLLPDGNGRELIAWIRQHDIDVEPIFLSAWFRDVQTIRSLHDELGVRFVLPKPVDLLELRLRMAGLMEPTLMPNAEDEVKRDTLPKPGPAATTAQPIDPFAALRAAYAKRLDGFLSELGRGVDTLVDPDADPDADPDVDADTDSTNDATLRLAHRLHGTAGTYGFHQVSLVSGRIETLLADSDPTQLTGDPQLRSLSQELAALRERLAVAQPLPAASEASGPSGRPTRVLLVEPDTAQQIPLQRVAGERMIDLVVATTEAQALERVREAPPTCAVISLDLGPDSDPFRLVRRLRRLPSCHDLRVAFVSPEDSVPLRLATANAADGLFLVAPVSPHRFVEVVRRLDHKDTERPKVLILEDDPAFASLAASCLTANGMDVTTLDDPTRCLELLDETQPDLVLLDIVMPLLSGFDVCRIIRSSPRWGEIPLVMVTARLGPEVRIAAFHAGADDYVAKPIVEAELVARVSQRISRARQQQARRERDALTDLLLRRPFTERVAERLATARRRDEPLSLALIDLDHFKQVNDEYGHLAGDQVLAVLGQLIVQRLRADDVCARWGGEELAIAFANADAAQAGVALDRIRQRFADLRFPAADGRDFAVTFSAGVATSMAGDVGLETLLQRADTLLYEAKRSGRDQVRT